MISSMHRRVAGFVGLLGLTVMASTRPALAQQADSDWFEDPGSSATPAPAPGQGAPQRPAYGPQGQAIAPEQDVPPQSAPQGPQAPQDDVAETDPQALSEFRPTLDPYGSWIEDGKYGTVWVPNHDAVGDDFAPYVSAGHWALTEDNDWVWQSDYPFGGVVFHYGRWVWVPGTGWAWVAGRRYANAWVTWRVPTDDYGYVGWAPMPPAWGWYGGSAVSLGWYPPAPYVFCPSGYAFSYHVHSYIVHDRYVIRDVAGHTRNYSYGSTIGRTAASPRVLPANSAPPRGPTLQSAHISASAAPASRISRGSFSGVRSNASSSFGSSYTRSDSSRAVPHPYSASTYGSGNRVYSNPSGSARPGYSNQATSYSRPSSYRAAPQRSYYAAPSAAPRPYYAAPSSRSYSVPSTRYSAPVTNYSTPSRSYSAPARSYSAPARSYSAPARSYSAPARSYSAPARSYSAPSAPSFHSHSRR
jgi:hypothetical protein